MTHELAKTYEPQNVEDRIYKSWIDGGYFHAQVDPSKKPYTIVIPPPNITGQLHMGHAMDETLQDILIRFRRMQGYSALWLPGTDHASIATEAKIVEAMREEGITKEEIGREAFLKRAWAWKEKYGGRIVEQLKKLGSSCDWERERFTLDEGCSKAVREVFVRLYEKGLIYRGERIINWCPHCKTSISDAEVEFEEKDGFFWHIRYPYADGSGYIELATTRPETMLGDTAVAVHPDDERYRDKVGKMLILPLVNKEIPLIADEYVEMDFGTGVVKITPAHDPNDFEVGLRHNLPVINVMDEEGYMNENAGAYAGMSALEARAQIVKDLEAQGLLLRVEPIRHNVGTCYRCGTVVEPMISKQWFVRMKPLAEPAVRAVETGKIRFIPERMDKIYFSWMNNIKDWCISRQLWWGHRIPAWYCDTCGELFVSREDLTVCPKCGKPLRQDPDTLDTWFSSALWPFSTLGWPQQTEDLKYFYPTDVLVTGYDIIFFWVIRMVFSGFEQMGETPFHTVLFHGLVRDSQGRKMSKSLGNGIDPLEVIDKYGADALRLTLVTGNAPGNDMRFYWEQIEASRNFANKIWNASRFIMMNLPEEEIGRPEKLSSADRWILSAMNTLIRDVQENMDRYELGIAVQKVHDFLWDEFCDWYIEIAKLRLMNKEADPEAAKAALYTLKEVLGTGMKLLHPFMPFISEEIYCTLHPEEETVVTAAWPVYDPEREYPEDERRIALFKELVRGVRAIRQERNVPHSVRTEVVLVPKNEENASDLRILREEIAMERMLMASEVRIGGAAPAEESLTVVASGMTAYIPLAELVDVEKETERLLAERKKTEAEIARAEGMLANERFVAKAPAAKVEEERRKLEKYKGMLEQITAQLRAYGR